MPKSKSKLRDLIARPGKIVPPAEGSPYTPADLVKDITRPSEVDEAGWVWQKQPETKPTT